MSTEPECDTIDPFTLGFYVTCGPCGSVDVRAEHGPGGVALVCRGCGHRAVLGDGEGGRASGDKQPNMS